MQREAPGIAECARDLQELELAVAGIGASVGPVAVYVRGASAHRRHVGQVGPQQTAANVDEAGGSSAR